jgi:hypothetical protein
MPSAAQGNGRSPFSVPVRSEHDPLNETQLPRGKRESLREDQVRDLLNPAFSKVCQSYKRETGRDFMSDLSIYGAKYSNGAWVLDSRSAATVLRLVRSELLNCPTVFRSFRRSRERRAFDFELEENLQGGLLHKGNRLFARLPVAPQGFVKECYDSGIRGLTTSDLIVGMNLDTGATVLRGRSTFPALIPYMVENVVTSGKNAAKPAKLEKSKIPFTRVTSALEQHAMFDGYYRGFTSAGLTLVVLDQRSPEGSHFRVFVGSRDGMHEVQADSPDTKSFLPQSFCGIITDGTDGGIEIAISPDKEGCLRLNGMLTYPQAFRAS